MWLVPRRTGQLSGGGPSVPEGMMLKLVWENKTLPNKEKGGAPSRVNLITQAWPQRTAPCSVYCKSWLFAADIYGKR